jgi:hypothetical protein
MRSRAVSDADLTCGVGTVKVRTLMPLAVCDTPAEAPTPMAVSAIASQPESTHAVATTPHSHHHRGRAGVDDIGLF